VDKMALSNDIRMLADSAGIDVLGFSDASEFSGYILLHSRRRTPERSLPGARSIIVAGIYIGGLVLPSWENPSFGRTSRLFLSGYFADVVKPLEPIVSFLQREGYKAILCESSGNEGSILPLKLAAVRAGLGWQGKHSLLISKKFGTFLALGGILTDADLEHNTKKEPDRYIDCEKCLQACPVAALETVYVLNKERCLSYLLQTEQIPQEVQSVVKNRVLDCEICQQACPWNARHIKKPMETEMTRTFKRNISAWEDFFLLSNLADLTEPDYRKILWPLNAGIPFAVFRRNVLAALEGAKHG
jgi:epoxyqueuosine reductase